MKLGEIWKKKGEIPTYLKWIIRCGLQGDYLIGTEMAYWDIELNKKRPEGWSQRFFGEDVIPAINILEDTFNEKIRIIELGPGPVSRLTKLYEESKCILVGVDPLADKYKKYLGSANFLKKGYGENLDKIFNDNSFHMAYASNVLDHSRDPQKCFINLYKLLLPGGLIIIQGNVREGSRTMWSGLHKHDLYLENTDLWSHTRYKQPLCLNAGLALQFVTKRETSLDGNLWFSITYRKL